MSTVENKPKRKRRTKEEIDAAVAAGTYKRRPSQAKKKKEKEDDSLKGFLDDKDNRLHAEGQCLKLWTILTQGEPIEDAKTRVFSSKEVVDKTNMSHKTAQQLFLLLRAFGLLKFVKGSHRFTLNFDADRRHKTIETEVLAMAELLNSDILRYRASIDADEESSAKEKEKLWNDLISKLNSILQLK